jgi:hypothetical protein
MAVTSGRPRRHEVKALMKRRRWRNRGASGNAVEAMGVQGGSDNGVQAIGESAMRARPFTRLFPEG